MALFKKTTAKAESKPKAEKKEVKAKEIVVAEVVKAAPAQKKGKGLSLEQVLLNPHVTEKASDLSEKGVYAFNVNMRANKAEVTRAITAFFKVTPTKVAVVINKPKYSRNPRTNRVQVKKAATKKALVYLKKGDKIEFV
jgi:large subunit ribosomal protein L23